MLLEVKFFPLPGNEQSFFGRPKCGNTSTWPDTAILNALNSKIMVGSIFFFFLLGKSL